MFDWLTRWFLPKPPPVVPLEDVLLAKFRETGRCPDCGGLLMSGPEGGCCRNVKCEDCDARFNIGWMDQWPFYMARLGEKP